ncbi:MAG: HEPN domain-containing protein [Candidatus Bathyarchaeia archaeon]
MSRWLVEAGRWMADAEEDLSVARDLLASMHYAASCFHSQQAGEKAVKSCLYALGAEAKGHSITGLLRILEEVTGKRFDELIDDAKLLDKHYSPPRYPNLHPSVESPAYELYTRRDAESCLLSAEKVLEHMKELLRQLSVT